MSDKQLVWLHGEVKTPPFSASARHKAGYLLRLVQAGTMLAMPPLAPDAVDWGPLPRVARS